MCVCVCACLCVCVCVCVCHMCDQCESPSSTAGTNATTRHTRVYDVEDLQSSTRRLMAAHRRLMSMRAARQRMQQHLMKASAGTQMLIFLPLLVRECSCFGPLALVFSCSWCATSSCMVLRTLQAAAGIGDAAYCRHSLRTRSSYIQQHTLRRTACHHMPVIPVQPLVAWAPPNARAFHVFCLGESAWALLSALDLDTRVYCVYRCYQTGTLLCVSSAHWTWHRQISHAPQTRLWPYNVRPQCCVLGLRWSAHVWSRD